MHLSKHLCQGETHCSHRNVVNTVVCPSFSQRTAAVAVRCKQIIFSIFPSHPFTSFNLSLHQSLALPLSLPFSLALPPNLLHLSSLALFPTNSSLLDLPKLQFLSPQTGKLLLSIWTPRLCVKNWKLSTTRQLMQS